VVDYDSRRYHVNALLPYAECHFQSDLQAFEEPVAVLQQNANRVGIGGCYSFMSQFISLELPVDVLERLNGRSDYDDLEDALLYSRLAHERQHFIQNVSTTYGMWKTSILRMAGMCAFGCIMLQNKSGGFAIAPPYMDKFPTSDVVLRDCKEPVTMAAEAAMFRNWVRLVDGPVAASKKCAAMHIDGVTFPEGTTHVHTIDTVGVRGILAANEIIEFQARTAELDCLYHTKGMSSPHRDEIIPTIWSDHPSQSPLRISDRAFDRRDRLSWLASLAMSELALNADWPFLTVGTLQSRRWEDLHPGWRFARLCDYVREMKLTPPDDDPAARQIFKDRLAAALGWASEREALRRAILSLETGPLCRTIFFEVARSASSFLENRPCDLSITSSRDPAFALIIGRYCAGPLSTYSPPKDLEACTLDIALQLLLSDHIVCPYCFRRDHEEGCEGIRVVGFLMSDR
jgi:hypothetical protein